MIVVIDNYDSFTYNLVDYLGKLSDLPMRVFRNDRVGTEEIRELQPKYIVISPGPKAPKDAGISKSVIREFGASVPVLGVCLGHQAIGEEFGGEIVRAKEPKHGKTSQILHREDPLFDGIPNPFQATRYHSLVVSFAKPSDELVPIAVSVDDSEIMALRHKEYDIYGVQFHPESIYTPAGLRLIENFLDIRKEDRLATMLAASLREVKGANQ
jgi:anthranilate synthase/aminodeoxychorismate synthase-like glutamine amidotransferase